MKPDSSIKSSLVCAIVVTYHPNLVALQNLLAVLRSQVATIVIVDNGSSSDSIAWIASQQGEKLILFSLEQNIGVAAAHNYAIRWAQHGGFTHVVLFDQDSVPFPDMIVQLLAGEAELLRIGLKVAAVGPQYFDPRLSRPAPFIQFVRARSVRTYCKSDEQVFHPADSLISSGMLIRISILNEIGLMDMRLFIDYVDIEWCFRAKQEGYRCFGICSAKMNHTIGDRIISWRNGKRIIPIHNPLRNYYLIRNAILLYKRDYMPRIWKLRDAWRLLLRYIFFSFLISPRFLNFRMMTMGLWHGIIGKSGRFTGNWQIKNPVS